MEKDEVIKELLEFSKGKNKQLMFVSAGLTMAVGALVYDNFRLREQLRRKDSELLQNLRH